MIEDCLRCPCEGRYFGEWHTYTSPPKGEGNFKFKSNGSYSRTISKCAVCSHFVSVHEMSTGSLYSGEYVNANYGGIEGIRKSFERIVNMDSSKSDNYWRVERVCQFGERNFPTESNNRSILDVGSGLCVFLHGMKQRGWYCTALDPDERSVEHARDYVGVNAVRADFMTVENLGRYDVIAFNKVLEHVDDPVNMLSQSLNLLNPNGFIYCEVPDGETAAGISPAREEFFIEHPHIFSAASLMLMVFRAGLIVKDFQRITEPSGKHSLIAFMALT